MKHPLFILACQLASCMTIMQVLFKHPHNCNFSYMLYLEVNQLSAGMLSLWLLVYFYLSSFLGCSLKRSCSNWTGAYYTSQGCIWSVSLQSPILCLLIHYRSLYKALSATKISFPIKVWPALFYVTLTQARHFEIDNLNWKNNLPVRLTCHAFSWFDIGRPK